jgi:hypothetical protein
MPRRDLTTYDGLGQFCRTQGRAEPSWRQSAGACPIPEPLAEFRWRVQQSVSTSPTLPQWAKGSLLAGGAVLAGAALDKPVDRFVSKHQDRARVRAWDNVGKACRLCWPAAAARCRVRRFAHAEHGHHLAAVDRLPPLVSMATKRVVQRARPGEARACGARRRSAPNVLPVESRGGGVCRGDAVRPGIRCAMAVWPGGRRLDGPRRRSPALGVGRGRGRCVGYAMGSWLWQAQRDNTRSSFAVAPGPKSHDLDHRRRRLYRQ